MVIPNLLMNKYIVTDKENDGDTEFANEYETWPFSTPTILSV